nr:MAG TPA: hypothetical protein [Caudoviricetes sp.]
MTILLLYRTVGKQTLLETPLLFTFVTRFLLRKPDSKNYRIGLLLQHESK